MRRRTTRLCGSAVFFCFLPWGNAFAQLQGHFSLQKGQYEVGEPIYLQFDLTNVGKESVRLIRGDRYSNCGGYKIEVWSGPPISHSSCDRGFAGSCLAGEQIVAPGGTIHERLLLNYQHHLAKAATYDIHAALLVSYGSNREELSVPADTLRVAEDFQIQLTDGTRETLKSAFQPFLADLASKEEERQREAARVIGSLAPAFLEDTILSMMVSATARPFALLGLRRLDTVRSRAALAEIVEGTAGYSYEKERAIKYLSEMCDRKYFPLLLSVARQQPPNQARDYVLAAARLGGENALPFVDSLLEDSDPLSHANGVMALSETGTPQCYSHPDRNLEKQGNRPRKARFHWTNRADASNSFCGRQNVQ